MNTLKLDLIVIVVYSLKCLTVVKLRTDEKGGSQGSYQGPWGLEGPAKDRLCIKKVFTAFSARDLKSPRIHRPSPSLDSPGETCHVYC